MLNKVQNGRKNLNLKNLFSWRIWHIIVRCVIRCSFWQLTFKIDEIEDKTWILIRNSSRKKDTISLWTSLTVSFEVSNRKPALIYQKFFMIPYHCDLCDTKFISTTIFEVSNRKQGLTSEILHKHDSIPLWHRWYKICFNS